MGARGPAQRTMVRKDNIFPLTPNILLTSASYNWLPGLQCSARGCPDPPAQALSKTQSRFTISPPGSRRKGKPGKRNPTNAELSSQRFHDTRHHAITELAETAASDQVIRSIAGHVSQKMLEHYSHLRLEAKWRALDALATTRAESPNQGTLEGVYVTRNVTKEAVSGDLHPQVIQKAGGDEGTRTPDLMRDRHHNQGYLVDVAARLATVSHSKAPSERSSWTDFGLVPQLLLPAKCVPISNSLEVEVIPTQPELCGNRCEGSGDKRY